MALLRMDAVNLAYGPIQAVSSASIEVEKGQTVAIVGANGAGKTTLLRAIAGAHLPSGGRIVVDATDVTAMPAHKRVGFGIALVPEGRRLFAQMTVEENLLLARSARRPGAWTVDVVMETFPQLKRRRTAKAGTLSGGEQQATAIGRALMTNPDILLLDEISLGLSPIAVEQVYASLTSLMKSGTTCIIVEQDLNRAIAVADRVICMLEGRIVLEGRSTQLSREQITQAYFGLPEAKVKDPAS
jgi:branched-chain amino acid transport system ATP-binding protein